MPKALLFTTFLCLGPLPALQAVDAFSPVERALGGSSVFDPAPYADQDLDEEKRFAPESAGDSDLGEQLILARAPRRAPIRLEADTGVFWSDNIAAATPALETDGWFWANRGGLTWRPRIGDNLFVDTFVFEDVYRYDRGPLDFESTEAGVGLVKIFPEWGDLLLFGRYEFLYVHADNPAISFFSPKSHLTNRFHRLRFGAHKVFLSAPRHTAYLGTEALFDLDASPARLERHEFGLRTGYTFHATDKLKLTAIARATYLDYQNGPREDWHYATGLEVTYLLTDRTRLFASLLYGKNDSNSFGGINDYEAIQGGIGAGLHLAF
ncbi:MAG: hypothetical protein HKN82_18035 [Akkermansiaceae bacterium]|nr:hypothetical protein [Akkermansiaceae bacterium]